MFWDASGGHLCGSEARWTGEIERGLRAQSRLKAHCDANRINLVREVRLVRIRRGQRNVTGALIRDADGFQDSDCVILLDPVSVLRDVGVSKTHVWIRFPRKSDRVGRCVEIATAGGGDGQRCDECDFTGEATGGRNRDWSSTRQQGSKQGCMDR